jgi:phosphate-selective porin OprO/OprP
VLLSLLRASFIDLNDNVFRLAAGGVRGGYETNYTAGLNWYWNSYLRFMFNYLRADVRRITATNFNAGGGADIYTLRVQQEW